MKYIPIGRAVGTHGLKGEVKVSYYNEAKDDFLRYASLFVRKGDEYAELHPIGRRIQKNLYLIKLKGFETPEEVFPLLNKELFVREEDLPALEDGEYYDYQLMGLNVTNRKNEIIGVVKAVVHTKGQDLLTVATGGEEIFIPLTEEFIEKVNLKDSSIIIDESALVE
ncbi:MAG TPA: ribosome maturation factor RimM [Syntrophorhabdaceae bacterium]|jgi:16S rRNA processing protein RimM